MFQCQCLSQQCCAAHRHTCLLCSSHSHNQVRATCWSAPVLLDQAPHVCCVQSSASSGTPAASVLQRTSSWGPFMVTYGTGQVAGTVAADSLTVGNITVANQGFGLVLRASTDFLDISCDGLFVRSSLLLCYPWPCVFCGSVMKTQSCAREALWPGGSYCGPRLPSNPAFWPCALKMGCPCWLGP